MKHIAPSFLPAKSVLDTDIVLGAPQKRKVVAIGLATLIRFSTASGSDNKSDPHRLATSNCFSG
jgi:hypothetical protein